MQDTPHFGGVPPQVATPLDGTLHSVVQAPQ
jgi:hypothetical protein